MRPSRSWMLAVTLVCCLVILQPSPLSAGEPKKKPKNTITVQLGKPVKPQNFSHPPQFYVLDVVDRSGDPQPMLVFRRRGGVFLDREPRTIVRQALEASLEAAELLAPEQAQADYLLTVYLFHFGLASRVLKKSLSEHLR